VVNNPGSPREQWTRPTVRVDWLQGSLAPELDEERTQARDAWLEQPYEEMRRPSGYPGYDRWLTDGHQTWVGHRMAEGIVARTFLVMRGAGIQSLRGYGVDDQALVDQADRWDFKATRLDLAIDVKHPKVTPLALYRLRRRGRVVTRLSRPTLDGDPEEGQTFYLRSNDLTLRIYDKTAEQARKGVHLEEGITRFEMELHRGEAKKAFLRLAAIESDRWNEEFPAFVQGLLLARFRPLNVKKPDRNPQRAPLWKPFVQALDDVAPVRLGNDEIDATMQQRIWGKARHVQNNRRPMRFVLELVGEATFLQLVRSGQLDAMEQVALDWASNSPESLQAVLSDLGITLDDDGPEERPLWP
jgi:hypothetical protein